MFFHGDDVCLCTHLLAHLSAGKESLFSRPDAFLSISNASQCCEYKYMLDTKSFLEFFVVEYKLEGKARFNQMAPKKCV